MDSPGTWESLGGDPFSDSRWCRGLERDLAYAEVSAARERTEGDGKWERRSEQISNAVVATGRLSALIVLITSGNAARADPTEGSGAPLLQSRS
jgi:hypothetical protein